MTHRDYKLHVFKKIILSSALVLVSSLAQAVEKPYIISGFDDVLRQAENTGLVKSGIKMFEKDKTFTGMPELYTTISAEEPAPKFTLVSATSTMFNNRVTDFLDRSDFPVRQLDLRNWVTERSIEDFKLSHVSEIMAQRPGRKFIVIFDNSDPSLSMAQTIHEKFSDKIPVVYLRNVIKKNMPASAHPFYTAFDIVLNEYNSGRADLTDVNTVAQAILNEGELEHLIPSYALCPKDYDPCQGADKDAAPICAEVKAHVQALCGERF